MKVIRVVGIVILVYVGIVVAFESMIGFFQPTARSTLVITTIDGDGTSNDRVVIDGDGTSNDRVVSSLTSNDQLYVAANHWPRAWYKRALENPNVQVTLDSEQGDYLAVPVTGAEHDRVDEDHSLPFVFRILTGFPPRYFVRLDPQPANRS